MKGASVDELVEHCDAVAQRDPAGGLLPADRRRRHPAADGVLAPLRRHRQRDRDQDGAVQPLPHARRRARRGRCARRGPRDALHRQRRPHRARPAGAVRGEARRRRGDACASAAACSVTGACGRRARSSMLERIHRAIDSRPDRDPLLALDSRVTDCNSAFFDVAHDFAGCIPGCHEVLRRQGLLEGIWCLDPDGDAFAGTGARRSTASAASTPICPTTRSSRATSRAGWPECNDPHAPFARCRGRVSGFGRPAPLPQHGPPAARPYTLGIAAHLLLLLAWYLFVRIGEVPQVRHAVAGDTLRRAAVSPTTTGGATSRSPAPRSSAATPGAGGRRARWRCCSPGRRRSRRCCCRCWSRST